ncbi:MAG: hypothetical protein H7061_06545 [Bdellovibrionaceae bacterium]|nr:hypothetical protein [Bdellovibrio sp.]
MSYRLILIFTFSFLGMSAGAQSLSASSYVCRLWPGKLLGSWEFDLFSSEQATQRESTFHYQKNINPFVGEEVVFLTSSKITDQGYWRVFTSEQVEISIDRSTTLPCGFETEKDNHCWTAKVTRLQDPKQDIGSESLKQLMSAKWECYGK